MITWHIVLARQLDAQKSTHFRFFKEAIKFRQAHRVFGRENFLTKVTLFPSPLYLICTMVMSQL